MPRWILRDCDVCGGQHRSRAYAQKAHHPNGAPQRKKRTTRLLWHQMTHRQRLARYQKGRRPR